MMEKIKINRINLFKNGIDHIKLKWNQSNEINQWNAVPIWD